MSHVIFRCSPHFIDLALNEIQRAHPQVALQQHLTENHHLVKIPGSFGEFTRPWLKRLPIYLHHAFPVQHTVPLESLHDMIQKLAPPDTTLQIQTPDSPPSPMAKGRVLSGLVVDDRVYLGLSWAKQNLSPWGGGIMPITQPVGNRAGYKLLEAIHTFELRFHPHGHALDLGASPGAWTTILRQHGIRVTAVAPTPLYPWLQCDSGVEFHPCLAEEFIENCQTPFDLIVNDMVLDAQESARLMVAYAKHLRGIAIMTLKLRTIGDSRRVIDHSLRLLRPAYKIIRIRQLVYNKKEITLFLRRKT